MSLASQAPDVGPIPVARSLIHVEYIRLLSPLPLLCATHGTLMGMRLPALGMQQKDYNSPMTRAGHGSVFPGMAEDIRLVVDTAPDGSGETRDPRLYQLIRQKVPFVDRTFVIEFLDPGFHALDFTFG